MRITGTYLLCVLRAFVGIKWNNTCSALRAVPAAFVIIFIMITTMMIFIFTIIFIYKSLLHDIEGLYMSIREIIK